MESEVELESGGVSILVWCPLDDEQLARLRQAGYQVERFSAAATLSAEAQSAHIGKFDALMVGLDRVSAETMAAAQRLKIVARFGIGVDTVDVQAATELGIVVTNTPGASKIGVAELTIGLMFCLARQLPQHHNRTKAGGWDREVGFELCGKTLGIVGLGQVGQEVARRAACLGMQVLACDIHWDADFARQHNVQRRAFDDILRESDFVSLHVPATADTIGLMGENQLAMMKPGSMLLNTARGVLVDETALYGALTSGHLAGASLDVYAEEPPTDSALLSLNNVVLSPHLGGETHESRQNYSRMCTENVLAVLRGERPPNLVNPDVLGRLRSL